MKVAKSLANPHASFGLFPPVPVSYLMGTYSGSSDRYSSNGLHVLVLTRDVGSSHARPSALSPWMVVVREVDHASELTSAPFRTVLDAELTTGDQIG